MSAVRDFHVHLEVVAGLGTVIGRHRDVCRRLDEAKREYTGGFGRHMEIRRSASVYTDGRHTRLDGGGTAVGHLFVVGREQTL